MEDVSGYQDRSWKTVLSKTKKLENEMKPNLIPKTGRRGKHFAALLRHVKAPSFMSLLVHDPEYPGIAADDDAAGNEKRDDE